MRLIDADALIDTLGISDEEIDFKEILREAPTIEAVSIDDYRSMENTCYKLQKALYEMADRKTENSSEIPNNCKDLQDWKDRMWAEAIVTEPTTQTETQNSNLTFEKADERLKTTDYCDICKRDMCKDCIADATNPYCVPSHYEINYEPKTEPQTDGILFKGNLKEGDYKLIKTTNGWVLEGNDIAYYGEPQTSKLIDAYTKGWTDGADAVKAMPQTDCPWK